MEKINIRNLYIELLNKIRNVQGVDKDYVDGLIEIVDREITSLDSDINAIISVIPEAASVTDPLVITSDLASVAFSGSYNDLDNKPTIPAAQVNSDWNADSGVAQILNKPTIPAAQVNSDWNADSGVAQILNKPTIPAAQVNSDWNANSGVAQILNKPSLATVATSGSYNDLIDKPVTSSAFNTSVLTTDISWYGPDQSGYRYTYFDISGVIDDTKTAWINLIPAASGAIKPTDTEKTNYNLIVGLNIEQYSANVIRLTLYATQEPSATFKIQFNYYT